MEECLKEGWAPLAPQVIELSRRAAEHRAQSLLKELEEELAELRKRSAALSQLTLSEDYVHFLKVDQSCSQLVVRKHHDCHVSAVGVVRLQQRPRPRSSSWTLFFSGSESPFFFVFSPSLQTFPGLSAQPQTKDWSGVGVESELTSGAALRSVSHVMEQMQEEMQKLPESCECSIFSEAKRKSRRIHGELKWSHRRSRFPRASPLQPPSLFLLIFF